MPLVTLTQDTVSKGKGSSSGNLPEQVAGESSIVPSVEVQALCQNKLQEREFYCVIGRSSGYLPEQVAGESSIVPSIEAQALCQSKLLERALLYHQ